MPPRPTDHAARHHHAGHKAPAGMARLLAAFGHSAAGLRSAWDEAAFREEVYVAAVLAPLAYVIGDTWMETLLLWTTIVAVWVVELLNSAIEAAIDRVGLEWHPLSKRSKDMASAAVLLTISMSGVFWLFALIRYLVQ